MLRFTQSLIVIAAVLICFPAQADPFADLQPGEWADLPNTHLRPQVPNPIPPGYVGPPAVMGAWSGGAYDYRRDRLMVWGGGHGDYGGNEVYAFDIATLAWSRVWGPTPNTEIPPVGSSICSETYADGHPASRHTYAGLQILGSGLFWAQGGSLYCGSGAMGVDAWTLDPSTGSWTMLAPPPKEGVGSTPKAAYDPQTGHVFLQRYADFDEYDPSTKTWSVRGTYSAGWQGDEMTAAVDPVRRLWVAVGNGHLRVWDLSTNPATLTEPSTVGGSTVIGATAPGFEYDPNLKAFVAWVSGSDVYSLDMGTMTWTIHPAAATNVVTPSPPQMTGTFGRFRYIPSKNAYVLVSGIDEDAFIYKLSPGAGIPPDPIDAGSTGDGGFSGALDAGDDSSAPGRPDGASFGDDVNDAGGTGDDASLAVVGAASTGSSAGCGCALSEADGGGRDLMWRAGSLIAAGLALARRRRARAK